MIGTAERSSSRKYSSISKLITPSMLDSIEIDLNSHSNSLIDQVSMSTGDPNSNNSNRNNNNPGSNNNNNNSGGNSSDYLLGGMDMIFSDDSNPNNNTQNGTTTTANNNNNNKMEEDGGEGNNNTSTKSADEALAEELSNAAFFAAISNPSVDANRLNLSSIAISRVEGDASSRPAWHQEAMDKGSRQKMILEIARLLKSRKKTQPSTEWLQQLPHKARKLEERLYRAAPSLSAYQDLSTLKNRLRKVAQIITTQYTTAKSRHSFVSSRRGSHMTLGSTAADLRHSIAVPSFGQQASANSMFPQQPQHRDSMGSLGGGEGDGLDATGAQKPLNQQLAGGIQNLQQQAQMGGDNSSLSSGGGGGGNLPQPQTPMDVSVPQQTDGVANASQLEGSGDLLEQQKMLNEKLRMEIQDNIRKQNEWFQQLQTNPQQQGANGAPSNTGIQGNAMAMAAMQQNAMGGGNVMVQQQMAAMQQGMAGMQQTQPPGNLQAAGMAGSFSASFGGGGGANNPTAAAAAANLMNNPTAAARLQAMLLQQQQQGGGGVTPQQMALLQQQQAAAAAAQQGQFALANSNGGMAAAVGPQQQMLNQMLRSSGQQVASTGAPAAPGASAAAATSNDGNPKDGAATAAPSGHPPLSPGSFNW